MNITTSKNSNWKRINAQHVAVVAGVALAVGAVFARVGVEGRTSFVPQPEVAAGVQRQVSQTDIAASVLSTELATWEPVPSATAAKASSLWEALLVDPTQRDQLAADIAASVLSTERAQFGN
jgi:hypothetical protein